MRSIRCRFVSGWVVVFGAENGSLMNIARHGLPIHRRRAAEQHDRGTQHRDAERRADDSSAGKSARPRTRVVLGGISGPVEYGDGEDAQDVGALVEGAVATTAYRRGVDLFCHMYFFIPRPYSYIYSLNHEKCRRQHSLEAG